MNKFSRPYVPSLLLKASLDHTWSTTQFNNFSLRRLHLSFFGINFGGADFIRLLWFSMIKSERWASWIYRRKSQLFDLKTILGRLYLCQDCITFLASSRRHKWLSLTTEITWSLIIHDQTWYLLNSLFNSISLNLNELAPFLLVSKSNISLLLIQKV